MKKFLLFFTVFTMLLCIPVCSNAQNAKDGADITVYLNDACIDAINAYLPYRPVDGVKDKDALFISRQKTRISPKTVQFVVKNTLEKAGLSGRELSTHKLRHTAATLMYQHGDVDVLAIKEILGHESLSTTQIYTHIMDEQLKNAAASNPLSGIKAPKRPEIAIETPSGEGEET